ncbi:hypothetical protein LTR70_006036 [Exophiala xenobiotica]|uniref:Uncharacterized protein n=1 Tax=Lithohypha guttulata TaxID=1690604 RepID=A0ABR0KCE0_9EURO|nr:hypothetical protein LTR24_004772 [Lithohypha guttulata]KAK5317005.1 hypothetical protein LTR70_006036 [Exophiala xenobiotica]
MRSFMTVLRLVAQALLALLAVDSIITHFKPRYTNLSNHNRIHDELTIRRYGYAGQESSTSNHISYESDASPAHQRLHNQHSSSKADGAYTVTSWSSADRETAHYTLERTYTDQNAIPSQSVLFLTITRDEQSWGRNPDEKPRTIYSFLDFITNTTLTPSATSLAILTSSQHEFEQYKQVFTPSAENKDGKIYYDYPFHRATLTPHPAKKPPPPPPRKARHAIAQHERRATLAKLRNYLQSVSLTHESHLLWLDSDVYKFSSPAMVAHMMAHTHTTPAHEVGILTARCRVGEPEKTDAWLATHPSYTLPPPPRAGEPEDERRGVEGGPYEVIAHKLHANGHYDLNAWRGRRTGPNNIQLEALWRDLSSWEPQPAPAGGTQMLDQAIAGTSDDEVVRLDSVGGTVLMLRADLVRMGLNFATGYFVGMTFEHGEGYDGIETEGVCLLSRSLSRDGGMFGIPSFERKES